MLEQVHRTVLAGVQQWTEEAVEAASLRDRERRQQDVLARQQVVTVLARTIITKQHHVLSH